MGQGAARIQKWIEKKGFFHTLEDSLISIDEYRPEENERQALELLEWYTKQGHKVEIKERPEGKKAIIIDGKICSGGTDLAFMIVDGILYKEYGLYQIR